jgi:hypothetical protein
LQLKIDRMEQGNNVVKVVKEVDKSVDGELERIKGLYEIEKKSKEFYSKHFNAQMAKMYENKSTQAPEDESSVEFIFFDELIKNMVGDRKLRANQRDILMIDFFKFKSDLQKKINKFFEKQEEALKMRETIQEYVNKKERMLQQPLKKPQIPSEESPYHSFISRDPPITLSKNPIPTSISTQISNQAPRKSSLKPLSKQLKKAVLSPNPKKPISPTKGTPNIIHRLPDKI